MELTLQDDSVRNRIRTLILQGKKMTEILKEIGISENTYYVNYWRNTKGIRQFIIEAENERMKNLARKNIEEIASMPVGVDDDIRLLKIKADISQFVAETLDKDNFSKKTEIDNTQPVTINIKSFSDRIDTPIDTKEKILLDNVGQSTFCDTVALTGTVDNNNKEKATVEAGNQ